MVRHRRIHLVGAADIELLGLEPHPCGVVDGLARVNAEQHIVRGRVGAGEIMGVAGRDHRQPHPSRDVERSFGALLLNPDPVVLDLDEEPVLAEHPLIPGAEPLGVVRSLVKDIIGKLRGGTARQADQTLGVPLENLLVDPRLVIESFEERQGRQPHQVAESRPILGQKREVKRMLLARDAAAAPFGSSSRGDVRLEPHDRQDPGRLRLAQQLDGAIQVAVVRERHGRHAQVLGALHQVWNLAGTVQEAVMTMAV